MPYHLVVGGWLARWLARWGVAAAAAVSPRVICWTRELLFDSRGAHRLIKIDTFAGNQWNNLASSWRLLFSTRPGRTLRSDYSMKYSSESRVTPQTDWLWLAHPSTCSSSASSNFNCLSFYTTMTFPRLESTRLTDRRPIKVIGQTKGDYCAN